MTLWVNQAGVTQLDAARRSACPGPIGPDLFPRWFFCRPRCARSTNNPNEGICFLVSSFVDRAARVRQRTRRSMKLGLRLFVCMRFQDLFHSPPGVLFTFPSRYWFTIGRSRVFSLGGWSPHLQTGFHVPRPTCCALSSTADFSCTGLSPATAGLSRPFH